MPWRDNGDYYSFKPESIILHAPTTSGVYGLFNFRHQIWIGNAANIRDAVLHHRRRTNFRFSRFEPTGFTFELCPPELREARAQELIAEYRPVSGPKNPIGIATLWHSWRAPDARAFQTEIKVDAKPAAKKLPPAAPKPAKAQRRPALLLGRQNFRLVGALCGVVFLTVGVIGLLPYLKNSFRGMVREPAAIAESRDPQAENKMALAQTPEVAGQENTADAEKLTTPETPLASLDLSKVTTPQSAPSAASSWRDAAAQAKASDVAAPVAEKPAAEAKPAAAATPAVEKPVVAAAPSTVQPAKLNTAPGGWSVQALATTDKQLANDWLGKLKDKGYGAFIVDVEIKGIAWQRLRIGPFETRQEAEALRATLQSKEGFRDAFVAGRDKPVNTAAVSPR